MTEYAYARVSTTDQSEMRQIEKFNKIKVMKENIFIDKSTGANFERSGYQALKEKIKKGDILYLDSLDRLGREYDLMKNEWYELTRKKGAEIVVLDNDMLDSRKFKAMGDMGKLFEDQFLSMLSYAAHLERQKIKERQREGIEIAQKNGVKFGRPKKNNKTKLAAAFKMYDERTHTILEIEAITGISKATLYRRLKERDLNKSENKIR